VCACRLLVLALPFFTILCISHSCRHPIPVMANSSQDFDGKPTTERYSTDNIAPAHLEAGPAVSHGKLVAPPLVAAMTPEQRAEAEKKMRRKIDTRLLPMIILMYIMNCMLVFHEVYVVCVSGESCAC